MPQTHFNYDENNYNYEKKLVAVGRARLWRNLLFGTIGVMVLFIMAIGVLYLTTSKSPIIRSIDVEQPQARALSSKSRGKGISLDDVLMGRFSTRSFNGTWITGDEFLYESVDGSLNLFNVKNLETTVVVPGSVMREWLPFKYDLSPSRRYIMFVHDVQKLFRYSNLARHTIYEIKTGREIRLAPQRVVRRQNQPPLLYAQWAPKTDAIAFVFHNDLYYATSPDLDAMYRITDSGQIGTVFNGIPDWVYEEEIINSNSAMWFSPDGKKLAFATFDDTNVDTMNFPLYGRPGDLTFQYPLQQSIKYPKPGRNNPVVDLWVLDIDRLLAGSTEPVSRLPPPTSLASRDHYFTSVAWANITDLAIIWMNRHQNESIISICEARGKCTEDLVHVSPDHAWNDLYTAPMFDSAGESYLIILPTPQQPFGHFKHINYRNMKTKQLIPLTTGTYEVVDILSWDEENNLVYFSGAPSGKPEERHVYYVHDLNSPTPKKAFCITCDFKNDYNEACNYNAADMSKDSKYYALSCRGPGIPQTTLHESAGHKRMYLLEINDKVRKSLHDRVLPQEKRLEIDIKDGFKAQVSMKLPPNYDANANKKYPMLVYVYGGPGSQLVSDRFKIDWGDYLASQKDVIYVSIDGRGSGFAGDKKLHALYRSLGSVEVEDQIIVAKALLKSFPSIDDKRTAIWGWSYGGYVTAAVMGEDREDIFKCGISVAPVTSWLYYDTAYTERFMGLPTPEDNILAYDKSDVTKNVQNFKNKKFFLIHGTADDNVHYQQSMMLSRALELNDILFRSQSYPDENHGLAGVKRHHYHSMGAFLDECFNTVS